MQNAFTLKRAFTVAVAAATILWSVGIASFVSPLTANAQSLEDGDLVKGSLSTVYYYMDGERWTFPNEKTYFTWYEDFSDVETISDVTLASIPLAGNIVVRPGTWMVKIDTDPKTYVVTRGGEIRWVETEEVAEDLYGSDWSDWVIDVPDVFFTDYEEGLSMTTAEFVDGMLVEGSYYIIWDGEKRMVTDAGMTANRLQSKFLITDSSVDLDDYEDGSDITGYVPALSDTSQQETSEAVAEGDLMVSLSSDTPDSQTIPEFATNVQVMAIDFEGDSSDVTVNGLILDFEGVADEDVLENVYIYQDGARLTNGKSVNSSTRQVTFSALGVDVADGETATLWVVVDIDDDNAFDGSHTFGFSLDEDNITSTAESVAGDFPIESEMHTVTDSAAVGTVTIDETGSISDVTIGEEEAEIAKFTIEADDEDAMIEAVTLNIDDSGDHSNYQLWQGSTLLATGEDIGSDLVLFELDDTYTVEDGDTKTFTVTADIGGEPNDVILTALEETSDLMAIGGDFGFGMRVINNMADTGDACASSADECSYAEIIGGKLTVAFNGPSATTDLSIGGDNQSIFDFTITSQNWTQVNEFEFDIDGTNLCDGNDDSNFTSFTVVDEDGRTVAGPEEFATCVDGGATDTANSLTFSDEIIFEAGDSIDFSLVVDIEDTGDAAPGETIQATLDMSTIEAEDADNNDLVAGDDIVPTADLAGWDLELDDSSLEVTLAGTPTSKTVVTASQNVEFVGFSFEAGNASDITVTDVTFDVLVEDTSGGNVFLAGDAAPDFEVQDFINSCSIYDLAGALIDGPESLETTGELIFSGFDWTIAAGDGDKMIVKCNLANVALDGGNDDDYAISLIDHTAEDEEGDTVTDSAVAENNDDDGDQPDVIVTVTDAGTLTATLASDSPNSMIIVGSAEGTTVAKYRFSASTESFTVSELTLTDLSADDVADSVEISYANAAGTTKTKTRSLTSDTVTFSNLDFYVPADGTANLTVSIDAAAVSSTVGNSGNTIQIALEGDAADIEAVGVSSGTIVDELTGGDVDANVMELRKTKPTLSLASGSPSGAGAPGLDEVFRFNVAADSHGYVEIEELIFKFTSTDNAAVATLWNECDDATITTADFSLYNTDDLGTELEGADADWTFFDAAADDCDAGEPIVYIELDLNGGDEIQVDAGSTETFALYFDSTGAASGDNGDSIRFDLPRDTELETLAVADTITTMIWNDDTAGASAQADFVKTLPVTGGTIVY